MLEKRQMEKKKNINKTRDKGISNLSNGGPTQLTQQQIAFRERLNKKIIPVGESKVEGEKPAIDKEIYLPGEELGGGFNFEIPKDIPDFHPEALEPEPVITKSQEAKIDKEIYNLSEDLQPGYGGGFDFEIPNMDKESPKKVKKERKLGEKFSKLIKINDDAKEKIKKLKEQKEKLSWWQFLKKGKIDNQLSELAKVVSDSKKESKKQEKIERESKGKGQGIGDMLSSGELFKQHAREKFNNRWEKTKTLPFVNRFIEKQKLNFTTAEGLKNVAKNVGYAALLVGIGAMTAGTFQLAGASAILAGMASGGTTGVVRTFIDKWRGKIPPEQLSKKLLTNAAFGAALGGLGAYLIPGLIDNLKGWYNGTPEIPTNTILPTGEMPIVQGFDLPVSPESVAPTTVELPKEIFVPTPEMTYPVLTIGDNDSLWKFISQTVGSDKITGEGFKNHGREIAEYVSTQLQAQGFPTTGKTGVALKHVLDSANITGSEKFWKILPNGLNIDMSVINKIIK